jgi:hypothetical protein
VSILTQKKCTRCGEWKDLSNFHKDKNTSDGFTFRCKACASKARREDHAKNRERDNERSRSYWAKNTDRLHDHAREYGAAHKAEQADRGRRWYLANKLKAFLSAKSWKANNPEKKLESDRRWRANHPEKGIEYHAARRARESGNGGRYTAQEWQALKEFYGYACLCCGRREPEIALEPDHVLPVAMGGSGSIENIQPLCLSCNRKKSKKHIDYREGK